MTVILSLLLKQQKKTPLPLGKGVFKVKRTVSMAPPSLLHQRGSMSSLIAVRSSPSIVISMKAGTQMRSIPCGATKPRAIAIAFTAWFRAPAPMAWISALPFSLNTPANAPATEFGLDYVETFSTSILRPPIEYITV